jgi:hypothetical protein
VLLPPVVVEAKPLVPDSKRNWTTLVTARTLVVAEAAMRLLCLITAAVY